MANDTDDSTEQTTQLAFNFFMGALAVALLLGLGMLVQAVLL